MLPVGPPGRRDPLPVLALDLAAAVQALEEPLHRFDVDRSGITVRAIRRD